MTDWLQRTTDRLYAQRLVLLVLTHVVLVAFANQAAFWLRFDGVVPIPQQPYDTALLPLLVLIRLAVFLPMRLHQGVWRYASIWDLRRIVTGVAISSVLFWISVHLVLGITVYPRSVFIIDALLLVGLMSAVRLARRLYASTAPRAGDARRTLVYGAGDAGEMVVRDLLRRHDAGATPVGFIDDDPAKRGLKIHGVTVFGGGVDIQAAIERLRPDEILIAIPSAGPRTMRQLLAHVSKTSLPIRTLPRLQEIESGGASLAEVRDLSVADLLSRAPVGLDPDRVTALVRDRSVLVTGAGGSIGAELCRQLLQAGPARLVLFERSENALFDVHAELASRAPGGVLVPALGDVTDVPRLEHVFAAERPAVVFHAAAHKHVPLMEANPSEAVKNNVRGTRLVADAALRWGASRVVLISTDKAVNPSSVMGATKQIAERIIQRHARRHGSFCAVRFGNVLGSSGSVVPTFLAQIRAGGPVTVTHPEMRRYFMLIPEAVQLVLHAAALDEGAGAIYVLDMGDQIRIVDMARSLIRLAGYVPDQDVDITFTGIRPGEKLFEELVGPDELVEPSGIDAIRRIRAGADVADAALDEALEALEAHAAAGDDAAVLAALARLVPPLARSAGLAQVG
ncbi:MAG: polysaccharide biosynthesis protein [Vicinamibacterales bacterium]